MVDRSELRISSIESAKTISCVPGVVDSISRRSGEDDRKEVLGTTSGWCGQANKGARWMSWRPEAMKDVGTCDKPKGAGNQAVILGFLNGETHPQGYVHLNA